MTDPNLDETRSPRFKFLNGIPAPLQALLILTVAVVPALLVNGEIVSDTTPSEKTAVETLSLAEVLELSQVIWVDARPRTDYDRSHIPGALPLNEDTWETDLVELLMTWNPGDMIVVYCGSSRCDASTQVAQRLAQEVDLEPVATLAGGWDAYEASLK